MRYVALLRGINVGGNNKIDMKQLVAALEEAGFSDVSYYLNTGNIFLSSEAEPSVIIDRIQAVIEQTFQLSIKVLLRDAKHFQQIVAAMPGDWVNGAEMKVEVMFLWEEYDSEDVLDELTIKPGIDTVSYISGALLWHVARANVTKSGMQKLVGTKLYKHMTIRNCNTVRAIAERLRA